MVPEGMDFYSFGGYQQVMAWVVWFTGLPGCGKTTIAQRVKAILSEKGTSAKILQLDEIRRAITPHPRYTDEERDIVYASLAYMAKLLAEEGVNVIVDATANRRRYRDFARGLIRISGKYLYGRHWRSAWSAKLGEMQNFRQRISTRRQQWRGQQFQEST